MYIIIIILENFGLSAIILWAMPCLTDFLCQTLGGLDFFSVANLKTWKSQLGGTGVYWCNNNIPSQEK
jgi:hypothetical protein